MCTLVLTVGKSYLKMEMGTRNPSTRRVLPGNSSTHTRVPVDKKYPQNE